MSSEIKANTISEVTSANGVSIDGVLLKDGGATFTGAVTGLPASDTLISYAQVSSENQTFTIDNVFSDTYRSYRVIISGIIGAANMDTSVVNLRFLDDSGTQLSGAYYYYIGFARDSTDGDKNINGQGATNLNLSQNFGAESAKKENLSGVLHFSGTRTDSCWIRCEGVFTHEAGNNDLVTTTISGTYRATGGGNSKCRGFALIGGGSGNHWTTNSEGGVYVYGINHA